jgi:GNAT superfamily N-acetyltransferase
LTAARGGILRAMELDIRPGQAGDPAALAELAARTFPLACPPGLPREAIEAFVRDHLDETAFRGYLETPSHTVLVGRDPTGAARAYALLVTGTEMDEGCADMILDRPTVGVSKFYLDPALHGAGGATLLLDSVITAASRSGARSLWLATNVANGRARAFYSKNGFVERGHRTFVVGGQENDDVVYERALAG